MSARYNWILAWSVLGVVVAACGSERSFRQDDSGGAGGSSGGWSGGTSSARGGSLSGGESYGGQRANATGGASAQGGWGAGGDVAGQDGEGGERQGEQSGGRGTSGGAESAGEPDAGSGVGTAGTGYTAAGSGAGGGSGDACSTGALVCGDCLAWTFETGTHYWVQDTDPNWPVNGGGKINGAQRPTTSASVVYPGRSRSLQVPVNMDMQTTSYASVAVSICQSGGTTSLQGRTISIRLFFDGPSDFDPLSVLRAASWSAEGIDTCDLMWGTKMKVGAWITGSCQLGGDQQADHLAIMILPAGEPWTGSLYVDSVEVQ